ncbi:MAG: superoxide dismutase [Ni], partial [Desulfobacterales bacterium]
LVFMLGVVALPLGESALAHCEIPCGIYDDALRVSLITEHAGTIEKSMAQIKALQAETPVNYNQLIRWVTNKEHHANEVQNIVSQYFLTQRIKPDQAQYNEKVAVLHQMLVATMKCKQTIDPAQVETLRNLLKKFEGLYFEK